LSHLASSRQQQQSQGFRALGLFAAVCLNLALQPCAMALQSDSDPGCLHCPPAQTVEHGDMHGSMDHDVPCADGLSDCAIVEDLNHDGRGGQFKLKDAPTDLVIAIAPNEFTAPYHHPADATLHLRYALAIAGTTPPLHVLNCVYLK